jgi:hypothetical protein
MAVVIRNGSRLNYAGIGNIGLLQSLEGAAIWSRSAASSANCAKFKIYPVSGLTSHNVQTAHDT